jgi:hypothetical protein
MIFLVKEVLNPNNWLKLILNPKKISKVYERIFYYPSLRFGNTKSNFFKNFSIYLLIFFAKKKKSFKKIFFSPIVKNYQENDSNLYSMLESEGLNKEQKNTLCDFGIVVLENVLNNCELNQIKNEFLLPVNYNFFKDKNRVKSEDTSLTKINKYLDPSSKLLEISKNVSEYVYGKPVEPNYYYLYTKSLSIPEKDFPGDNILHVDRYLPNLKMIFFPNAVENYHSPFKYAIGSHKIDRDYINFFVNNKTWTFDQRNLGSKKFFKNVKDIVVKENSLIIALTNGFHCRSPFIKPSGRSAIFFTYPKFNLISLMN